MNFKLLLAALLVGTSAVACSVDASDPVSDDADGEEAQTSDADLTANASRLVGAYRGEGFGQPPSFQGLVFEANGTFFADLDTGIRCIKAPCPSNARIAGRFSATKNYLRLSPAKGEKADTFYGRYKYTLDAKGNLALTRGDFAPGWSNALVKAISYCTAPVDCEGQAIMHPMCVGSWSCEQRSCAYKCGVAENPFWPSSSSKLVAHSTAGFAPPAPPGSTCQVGAATYTYDVAAKTIAWEVCQYNADGKPFTNATGSKVLTSAQIASIVTSMTSLEESKQDICGADAPFRSLKVTTASGEKTFLDDFYACAKQGVYVSNIGSVFGTLRDVAGH